MNKKYTNRMMTTDTNNTTEYFSLIARLVSLVDVQDLSVWKQLLQDIDTIDANLKFQKERQSIVKEMLG